jgi:hypothetical protein
LAALFALTASTAFAAQGQSEESFKPASAPCHVAIEQCAKHVSALVAATMGEERQEVRSEPASAACHPARQMCGRAYRKSVALN